MILGLLHTVATFFRKSPPGNAIKTNSFEVFICDRDWTKTEAWICYCWWRNPFGIRLAYFCWKAGKVFTYDHSSQVFNSLTGGFQLFWCFMELMDRGRLYTSNGWPSLHRNLGFNAVPLIIEDAANLFSVILKAWHITAWRCFCKCSGSPGYSAAFTGDVSNAVDWIRFKIISADTSLYIIGFSLGGGIMMKYLSEQQQSSPKGSF